MAIQGSGQIKLTELATEFGGTAPYSLKAYYRGGGRVPTNNTNVPASGAIGLKNFYNAVNRITLSATIGANTTETSITTSNVPGYIAGITDLTVYVSSGVYVYSTNTANPALTLGTGFAAGDTIRLVNNGFIMGMGGNGGGNNINTPIAGSPGGPAISLGISATIDNTNASAYIGGGGGGGTGSNTFNCAGGGAGGGRGGNGFSTTGGAGGGPGQTGGTGTGTGGQGGGAGGGGALNSNTGLSGGGGGGGRIFPGTGGSSGGGSANNAGSGNGGGGWGAQGGSGTGSAQPGGKAVALNGNIVTWVAGNTTRVYGAVS